MTRKKKGRAIHGWLLIDKPSGVTSTSLVNKLKWILNAQKAGHAGTLDPDATGLLAVAFGEATKTTSFLTDALKSYHFKVTFGSETDSDDASGSVISHASYIPHSVEISEALAHFRGDIMQTPPHVSAVKIDGMRAYRLARDGEEFELAPRALYIENLDLIKFEPPHGYFTLTCGKGGYVRAIARDLGRNLKSAAHVAWLRRTHSGVFDVKDALDFREFQNATRDAAPLLEKALLPCDASLGHLAKVYVTKEGNAH